MSSPPSEARVDAPPRDLAALRALALDRPAARLAGVGADDRVALEAVAGAVEAGLVVPVLFGDPAAIAAVAPAGLLDRCELVPATGVEDAADRAVRADVDILMKGALRTDQLLRAALARDAGLRTGRLLSDVAFYDDRVQGAPRLVGVTDGGLSIAPSLADKRDIVRNAVAVLHRLGFARPRIAIMSATEAVTDAMPSTLDARALTEEAARGGFGACEVYGPLALDNALSPTAAAAKGIDHPVAGHADCLVAASIEAGNHLGKAAKYLAGSVLGHVIAGARVPILIPSRVESAEDKLTSICLGVICGGDG
jgi:phosphate butyryltransferase